MSGGRWFNRHAVEWVLYEAGGFPPHLLGTYLAMASRMGRDGKGAYPSAGTVALLIRKNERNTRKDIAELLDLKLLLPGDPQRAAGIRADRRPAVYDMPQRYVADDTPHDTAHTSPAPARYVADDRSQKTTGNGHGVSQSAPRGVATPLSGVSSATYKEFLKNSRKGAARDGAGAPPSPRPETRYLAPPCEACGKAFSQEQLADPDFRATVLGGGVLHAECEEEDEPRRVCRKCLEWAGDWDPVTGLCAGCRNEGEAAS